MISNFRMFSFVALSSNLFYALCMPETKELSLLGIKQIFTKTTADIMEDTIKWCFTPHRTIIVWNQLNSILKSRTNPSICVSRSLCSISIISFAWNLTKFLKVSELMVSWWGPIWPRNWIFWEKMVSLHNIVYISLIKYSLDSLGHQLPIEKHKID